METMQVGYSAEEKDALRALAYVSFQELATRISHRNTGKHSGDEAADKLLARIAADENLHMIFYRDLIRAALEIAPDQTVIAIAAEVIGFQMPGTGIPGFTRKGVRIADAGIYDIRIHRDDVLMPVLRHWKVLDLTFRSPEAQQAQSDLADHLDSLDELALRHEERRDARRERAAAKAGT
jgi:acyl-[acyl-carrier-protein] desaturase